jgi:hypothetical protein
MGRRKRVVFTGDLQAHPAVMAWASATSLDVVPECLHVYRERDRSALYRLAGVAPGGASVFAKRAVVARTKIERTVYEDILPLLPLTAPRYCGSWIDDPHGWLFIEDAGEERYCEQNPEHRALAGRWLATLHVGARDVPAARSLPDGGSARYLDHLLRARERIIGSLDHWRYPRHEIALLDTVLAYCDAIEARWALLEEALNDAPATVVHGDFRAKNGYIRRNGDGLSILPIDWETASWGAPAPDLTRIDLQAYWSVVRDAWPVDLEAVQAWCTIGLLFEAIAALDWESKTLNCESVLARSCTVDNLTTVLGRLMLPLRLIQLLE